MQRKKPVRERLGGRAGSMGVDFEAAAARAEARLPELEARLGYAFRERKLLLEAITHSTFANEVTLAGQPYERLEFLGDAVVDLLAADLLLVTLAEADEGLLTARRARVVSRDALAAQARDLGLGAFLRLGRGEQAGAGRGSILADAFEALVGAVFRDGGYDEVKRVFGPMLQRAVEGAADSVDFKTRLQEVCHQRGLSSPTYRVESISGPDHARVYTCAVEVAGTAIGRGSASSKKAAEQIGAGEALSALSKR